MSFVNENEINEGSAPVGFLNNLLALNPFGTTKKVIDLMKEANKIKVDMTTEKGEYFTTLKNLMEKYLVGHKVSAEEQDALKKEYEQTLRKSLSEHSKDLKIDNKDVKELVSQMFKANDSFDKELSDNSNTTTYLEKIPDIDAFKEAFKDKIKALEVKYNSLIKQAKDIASHTKNPEKRERLLVLYSNLINWIDINSANIALSYATDKEKEAIKANIKVRETLGGKFTSYSKTLDDDKDKDSKNDNSTKDKKLGRDPDDYITDFDYEKYRSDAELSESEKSIIKKGLEEFNKEKDKNIADAEEQKEEYKTLVRNVIEGGSRGLLVYGKGGLGKSFTVEQMLEKKELEQDVDYFLIKGAASPIKVFEKMKAHPDKLFVFDDADSMWKTTEGRNILKGALDSKEKGGYISWEKSGAKVDKDSNNSFYFTGKIIFISNMDGEEMKKDEDIAAILTRIEFLDFSFTNSQTYIMVSKLLRDNKMKWKDFGIPNDKVTDGDISYIGDIYDQVYFLNKHKITSVAPVRAVGVTMQKLKDVQVDIKDKTVNLTSNELHESITKSIEGKTKMSSK